VKDKKRKKKKSKLTKEGKKRRKSIEIKKVVKHMCKLDREPL
jgi:hypothetical protein